MSKHLSLGRSLPGMQDVAADHSTGISPNEECITLLRSGKQGLISCIQVDILKDEEIMVGKKIEGPRWPQILNTLKNVAQKKEPNMFVIFRSSIDVLLVKYIPDDALVTKKMIYASSASNLKSVLKELSTTTISIEEFNISEMHEMSHEYYIKKKNMPKPFTEMEMFEQEVAKQETAGGYSFLARLKEIETGKTPIPLPGLSSEKVPDVLKGKSCSVPKSKIKTDKLNFDEQKQKWQRLDKESQQDVDENNASKNQDKSDEEDEEDEDDGNETHSLARLLEIVKLREYEDHNIDKAQVEKYLPSKEYKAAFGISKKRFNELPAWKQKMLKQKAGKRGK